MYLVRFIQATCVEQRTTYALITITQALYFYYFAQIVFIESGSFFNIFYNFAQSHCVAYCHRNPLLPFNVGSVPISESDCHLAALPIIYQLIPKQIKHV
jgi:hypothetical protein